MAGTGWLWREPGQSIPSELFYRMVRASVLVVLTLCYRLRVRGKEHVPQTNGLLVISNHTSHLDPPLVGTSLPGRSMRAIARSGLFKFKPLAAVLAGVGTIPIRENEGDMAAMKKAIATLKSGRVVLIFPEGSRSPDGTIHEFKRGTWLLITRAGCDVLPAGVSGAFDAWPRTRRWPRLGGGRGCLVRFGPVIRRAELDGHDAESGLAMLRERVRELVDAPASARPHEHH